jgi:predicted metal-dependent phosphoesterase TrpH
MTDPARWWAVDLHVHTPGSQDAHDADYGLPADIVAAATAAGIDAIAVTDHNTAAWCGAVATAAADTDLIVLAGLPTDGSRRPSLATAEPAARKQPVPPT